MKPDIGLSMIGRRASDDCWEDSRLDGRDLRVGVTIYSRHPFINFVVRTRLALVRTTVLRSGLRRNQLHLLLSRHPLLLPYARPRWQRRRKRSNRRHSGRASAVKGS